MLESVEVGDVLVVAVAEEVVSLFGVCLEDRERSPVFESVDDRVPALLAYAGLMLPATTMELAGVASGRFRRRGRQDFHGQRELVGDPLCMTRCTPESMCPPTIVQEHHRAVRT